MSKRAERFSSSSFRHDHVIENWCEGDVDAYTNVQVMPSSVCLPPQPYITIKQRSYSALGVAREDCKLKGIDSAETKTEVPIRTAVTPDETGQPQRKDSGNCCCCGDAFQAEDKVVLFRSDIYHTLCFACGVCKTVMEPTKQFLVLDSGLPLCYGCSPVCYFCNEKVTKNHIGVLKKDFHEQCLNCTRCKKSFPKWSKIYASDGEPCCAECISPVFDESWGPKSTEQKDAKASGDESRCCSSAGSWQGCLLSSYPASKSLGSYSQSVTSLPLAVRMHSQLRPAISTPSLASVSTSQEKTEKMTMTSLQTVLHNELGISFLMNFCVEDCSIELVVFWLDVEHFKNFEGTSDDLKLFAHHIMLKYIGYYADLRLGLPGELEEKITLRMQSDSFSSDIFSDAQLYVYEKLRTEVLPQFLQSHDGLKYLEAVSNKDLHKRIFQRGALIKAKVTSFDKRKMESKYYVYEIEVEIREKCFMIYRRYSEFRALNQQLKDRYPNESFPSFPKKIILGRKQIRGVAKQRMKELNRYLQHLLSMATEVVQSPTVSKFLAQTEMDQEDEAFNKRLQQLQLSK